MTNYINDLTFTPFETHISYIIVELEFNSKESYDRKFLNYIKNHIEKYVLLYFMLPYTINIPLTSWELVTYCAIKSLISTGLHKQDLINGQIYDWLILDMKKYTLLDEYYNKVIDYTKNSDQQMIRIYNDLFDDLPEWHN